MPYEKLQLAGAHSEVLSWANHEFSIEEQSMLRNVSCLPCLFKHVALMPDAHLGKGSMVGSVVATKEAVIPATVGVGYRLRHDGCEDTVQERHPRR